LLFNSTQYAPALSDIEVIIEYIQGVLIMEVIDKGTGFPESEIKNVFKKFFRVNSSKTGGLGLGLSIVKGFVEAHNGTITVQNGEDAGAMFTIKITTEKSDINIL